MTFLCCIWKKCHNTHRQVLSSDVVREYRKIIVFSHASVFRSLKKPNTPDIFSQSVPLSDLSVLIGELCFLGCTHTTQSVPCLSTFDSQFVWLVWALHFVLKHSTFCRPWHGWKKWTSVRYGCTCTSKGMRRYHCDCLWRIYDKFTQTTADKEGRGDIRASTWYRTTGPSVSAPLV